VRSKARTAWTLSLPPVAPSENELPLHTPRRKAPPQSAVRCGGDKSDVSPRSRRVGKKLRLGRTQSEHFPAGSQQCKRDRSLVQSVSNNLNFLLGRFENALSRPCTKTNRRIATWDRPDQVGQGDASPIRADEPLGRNRTGRPTGKGSYARTPGSGIVRAAPRGVRPRRPPGRSRVMTPGVPQL